MSLGQPAWLRLLGPQSLRDGSSCLPAHSPTLSHHPRPPFPAMVTTFLSVAFHGMSPLPHIKKPHPVPQRVLLIVYSPNPLSLHPSILCLPLPLPHLSRVHTQHLPIRPPIRLAIHLPIRPPHPFTYSPISPPTGFSLDSQPTHLLCCTVNHPPTPPYYPFINSFTVWARKPFLPEAGRLSSCPPALSLTHVPSYPSGCCC